MTRRISRLKASAITALIAVMTLLPAPPASAASSAAAELSPTAVAQGATAVFTAMVFNATTSSMSSDHIQCLQVALPVGYSIDADAVVASSLTAERTWLAPTVDSSNRTVTWKVSGSGSPNPNRLRGQEFARLEIRAVAPSSAGTSDWSFRASSSVGCSSFSVHGIGVRVTDAPPSSYRYSVDLRDGDGALTTEPVRPGAATFRVRISNTSTTDSKPIEYASVAVPSCFADVGVQDLVLGKVKDSQSRSWTPSIRGNVIRLHRDSNGLVRGQHVQIRLSADIGSCPRGAYGFSTAAWENYGPSNSGEKAFANTSGDPQFLVNTPPGVPSLQAPVADQQLANPTPTFAWSTTTDADGDAVTYQLQVAGRCDFDSLLVDEARLDILAFTISDELVDGGYCWRVRAHDGIVAGDWSATREFTVDTALPAVAITFPVDGEVYRATSWDLGCDTAGICGTAQPHGTSVASAAVELAGPAGSSELLAMLVDETWTAPLLAATIVDGAYVVTAVAVDGAGNTAQTTAAFTLDTHAPGDVQFHGTLVAGPAHVAGAVPPAPTCTATDELDPAPVCVVTGYSTAVGAHEVTATATDWAGNNATTVFAYGVAQPSTGTDDDDEPIIPPRGPANGSGGGSGAPAAPIPPSEPAGPTTFKSAESADAAQPFAVWVTSPQHGEITVVKRPSGLLLGGFTAGVTAPVATAANPLHLQFRLHAAGLLGAHPEDVLVYRDGSLVADCRGTGAVPDPCVADRSHVGGEFLVSVRSSRGGSYLVGFERPVATTCSEQGTRHAFADIADESVHRDAVACIAWLGIAQGTAADAFTPAAAVTRGQVASFLARAIDYAGVPLSGGETRFGDTAGSVHAEAVERLAAAGLVHGVHPDRFEPQQTVSRAQMASLLVRVHEHITGVPLPDGNDRFGDDGGSIHEANIDKAVEARLIEGRSDGLFLPSEALRRDQMASLLHRLLQATTDLV